MRSTLLPASIVVVAACGGTAPRYPLIAEAMRGPSAGPAGRLLVMTATCGSLEAECRSAWAPAVDQIVLAALEFRGYDTIDPQTLRKDERKRDERIEEHDSDVSNRSRESSGGIGFIGILPIAGAGGSKTANVTISHSRHRTVILSGANYEDLRLEDKKALMSLAGAASVATTRVVVGANHGTWTLAQNVEVIIKLTAADTGDMRWSTRCMASSKGHRNVEAAIEDAARCAASAFSLNQ